MPFYRVQQKDTEARLYVARDEDHPRTLSLGCSTLRQAVRKLGCITLEDFRTALAVEKVISAVYIHGKRNN
jgi:hypothetical protein